MPSEPKRPDVVAFFERKQAWSKYKDLILDYYLTPYLHKVACLGKPIAVIDCFAGAGRFGDGEEGSPLIIGRRLAELTARGHDAKAVFIEKDADLFARLRENTQGLPITHEELVGDFHSHVDHLVDLARTHTVFTYVDPIRPGDLLFGDLAGVYSRIQQGQSVETLINFLSVGFVRRTLGMLPRVLGEGTAEDEDADAWADDEVDAQCELDHREVAACNEIAGGDYWQTHATKPHMSFADRVDAVAGGYANELRRWFRWVLYYPIRERYQIKHPKYHLVFGSRYSDAVDLMNRAMVKARREFVGAEFVKDHLFPNQPSEEVPDPAEVRRALLQTSAEVGRCEWRMLRAEVTVRKPCKYTDSEWNREIKLCIQQGLLASTCSGTRIENRAPVWLAK